MITKEVFSKIIKNYKPENVEFGKDENYLCFRNNATKEEMIQDLLSLEKAEIIEKQEKHGEERYAVYFIYTKIKGRVYILRFYPEKIRIITIFPLGKKTLIKYFKRKFKKEENPY